MKKGRSFFDLLPFFLFMVQISFPKNRLYEGYTIRYSIRVPGSTSVLSEYLMIPSGVDNMRFILPACDVNKIPSR
jgi:hypothetical protein